VVVVGVELEAVVAGVYEDDEDVTEVEERSKLRGSCLGGDASIGA
jgi:hypothetical protein